MPGLREDVNGGKIQGFAPRKIITITADAAWTPTHGLDRAFRIGVACNYYMDADSGHEAALVPGSITVLSKHVGSYTFDETMEIEVM